MAYPKLSNGMISGKVTQEERDNLARFLEEKGATSAKCELCQNSRWILGDHIVTHLGLARNHDQFRQAPADPFYPTVPLMCSNCGNTKLINILISGCVDIPGSSEDG